MKIGYQTLTWANYYKDYSVEEPIHQIKEAGFEGIEFIEPIEKLGKADFLQSILSEIGLKPVSLSCGLNMDPNDTSDIEETKSRVDFAGKLGIENMMLCGGWLADGIKKEENSYKILGDKLNMCCEYASGLNMNIAFHPHKNTIVETREDIERLLEFTDKTKLCVDIAHLAACGSNPAEVIKRFGKIITYIHLKDWDVELDDFVELGKGEVDITKCLSVLKEIGYKGWAVVELDHTKKTPKESARINADYLRKAGAI